MKTNYITVYLGKRTKKGWSTSEKNNKVANNQQDLERYLKKGFEIKDKELFN